MKCINEGCDNEALKVNNLGNKDLMMCLNCRRLRKNEQDRASAKQCRDMRNSRKKKKK